MCLFNPTEFADQLKNVMYTSSKANHTLTGHVISSEKSVENSLQCMKYCANLANGDCKSFNHNAATGECQLNNETGRDNIDDMKLREGYGHYYITKTDPIMLPWRHSSLAGEEQQSQLFPSGVKMKKGT